MGGRFGPPAYLHSERDGRRETTQALQRIGRASRSHWRPVRPRLTPGRSPAGWPVL